VAFLGLGVRRPTNFKLTLTHGLSSRQAAERLQRYGPNELKREQPVSFWYKLWAQFQDFLTLILLAAATVSFVVGERTDALLIFLIILGKRHFRPHPRRPGRKSPYRPKGHGCAASHSDRDGKTITIPANQLVPGDLVLLETGAMPPCDLRLSQTASLKIDEATLTGESVRWKKTPNRL
jgi:Ca2+-transporting ATPase